MSQCGKVLSTNVHDKDYAMILIIIILSAMCYILLKGNLSSISMGFHLVRKGFKMIFIFLVGFILILMLLIWK